MPTARSPDGSSRALRKPGKKSAIARGRSPKVAKRIAAATTNKTRRWKGETKK